MSHVYTCEECGGTFHSQRSEDEAIMEYQQLFTEAERTTGASVVCDDCWKKIMGDLPDSEGGEL